MGIKTRWSIDHACGHVTEIDLSNRPADCRAGYARWLASRDCAECWKATRDADTEARAAWLKQQRAAEQEAAEAWETQYRMPPLDGGERAVAWAQRVRHQLVSDAYTALVLEGDLDDAAWEQLEETIRPLTRAGWWLDQREADPADLPELLVAATEADQPTENPHF